MIPQNEQETALVIDHSARVFHISSTRPGMINRLRKLAVQHGWVVDDPADQECVSLTNISTKFLTALSLSKVTNT
jgi:hypothetical protein